jgi:DNA-binding NarL/FixJ family response regulator
MNIKILIVDDHGIVREGLRLLFEQEDDLEVVAEASDGRQAVEAAGKLRPDIVLMDVTMPKLNGIDAAKKIIDEYPNVKVVALSAHCNKSFIADMLRAGVSGYILKDGMADELIRGIQVVIAGEQYLSPKVARIVIAEYITDHQSQSCMSLTSKLTTKERELIQLLAENKSNKEAARLLHVSIKTVDTRRRTAMGKLGITGIADLTKFAIREGLTTLDS